MDAVSNFDFGNIRFLKLNSIGSVCVKETTISDVSTSYAKTYGPRAHVDLCYVFLYVFASFDASDP